jgi:Tfp pilus assembly protein FimT
MKLKNQDGMTLAEVAVSTAVAMIVAGSVVTIATPMVARERLRSATYQIQSSMQVSRVEAVSRNRPTRFVLDENKKTLEVWDTRGTSDTADDKLVRRDQLPASVSLARPELDTKEAVTITGDVYGAHESVFASDGSVSKGTGEIALYGGGQFQKLTLFGAGSVDVERWVDDSWQKREEDLAEQTVDTEWEKVRADYVDDWTTVKEDYYEDPNPIINRDDYLPDDGTVTYPDDHTTDPVDPTTVNDPK